MDLIEKRYSCRNFAETPIADRLQRRLLAFMASHQTGPFGSTVRLALLAASEDDREALKGLGTYGFVKNPAGYVVGVMPEAPAHNLEDFGFVMEQIVLYVTGQALGSVWLGGTFTKSRFAGAVGLQADESLPAVVALGHPAEGPRAWDAFVRRHAKAGQRLPWDRLFFEASGDGSVPPGKPLSPEAAGRYVEVLEMVRRAPSASNKQPWRITRAGERWHFYLQRTRGYAPRNALLGVADMQRIDMGIAMCHWALTADELGLSGRWKAAEPSIARPAGVTAYVASWVPV